MPSSPRRKVNSGVRRRVELPRGPRGADSCGIASHSFYNLERVLEADYADVVIEPDRIREKFKNDVKTADMVAARPGHAERCSREDVKRAASTACMRHSAMEILGCDDSELGEGDMEQNRAGAGYLRPRRACLAFDAVADI